MAKILIIDDDPQGREMLKVRLQKSGHDVREASDGEEGLRKAKESLPELIILDVRIPRVDGWEVCRRLKTEAPTQAIPVLMVTGCSQPVQEVYGRQCGADAYITKPWESAHLMRVLSELLFASKVAQEKEIEALKHRTEDFVLRIIRLVDRLPKTASAETIGRELVRCAATLGAVLRTSYSERSPEEFLPRIQAVGKEADQSIYYLGLLRQGHFFEDTEVSSLEQEGKALASIFAESAHAAKESLR